MTLKPVKGVYGTPWSKLFSKPLKIDRSVLDRLGKIIVECVVEEARKDFAKQGKSPKGPEGIPNTEDFFKSFSYQITGNSTVEVLSSWPYIKQVTEGRDPYKMTWLTQSNGVHVVPLIQQSGEVIFRMAPLRLGNAWVHPGFAKHTFIQRGIKKGREKAMKIITEEVRKTLMAGDPLR